MDDVPLVREAGYLLDQLIDYLDNELVTLSPVSQATLVVEANRLARQAESVESESDLLSLADAIHRMIETTPELQRELLPRGRTEASRTVYREVTSETRVKTRPRHEYAALRAAQLHNAVIRVLTSVDSSATADTASSQPPHVPPVQQERPAPPASEIS